MKKKSNQILTSYLLLVILSGLTLAAELDEHLIILEPLMETQWLGGYIDDQDIQIQLDFTSILNGKAIQYVRKAESVNYSAITHFYWDPDLNELCFVALNSRGIVEKGSVKTEAGKIILSGTSAWSDRTMTIKTILEIDSHGKLKDSFYRMERGQWTLGHVQEFVRK